MAPQSALDPRLQYGGGGHGAHHLPHQMAPAPPYKDEARGRSASVAAIPGLSQHHQQHPQPQAAQPQQGTAEQHHPYYLQAGGRGATYSVDSGDQLGDDENVQYSDDEDQHETPDSLHDADDPGDSSKTSPSKSDAKRPRACDSCRGLKVRCIIDPSSGQPCKRCAKAGRACIVTPPTRKRQKKADSRVAELEKKIDALTATLKAQNAAAHSDHENTSPQHYEANQRLLGATLERTTDHSKRAESPYASATRKRRRIDSDNTSRAHSPPPVDEETVRREILVSDNGEVMVTANNYNERKPTVFDHSDIEGRLDEWIDRETAEQLFDRYVKKFATQFPAVVFPPGTTAKQVRAQKPILYLAIIASTSYGCTVSRESQRNLAQEMRDVFADSMWRNGEKSLELIQALQIATLWYRPPKNFEQHMFYQIVHMAAIMAIDIGMGRSQMIKRRGPGPSMTLGRLLPNADTAEVRRAWLTCYLLCIAITMVLRRPILLRWNDYMQDCIDYLETAPDAFPSDVLFCQHVRLAHIAEEISMNFNLDDTASSASMADRRVIFGIKRFERDLAERVKKDTPDPALKMVENVTNLYIHEIALHYNQNDTDFKPPYNGDADKAPAQRLVGADHVDALSELAKSCKAILDSYLAFDFEALFMLPIIFSVRTVYTTVVLLKLYVAATTPGEMMNIIRKDELHVEIYLDRLQKHFQAIMDRDPAIPHAKFLFVIQRLNERYMTILRDVEMRQNSNQGPQISLTQPQNGPGSDTVQPNQGLHLLSEAAMGGGAPATNSAGLSTPGMPLHRMQFQRPAPHSQPQPGAHQQPNGQWYAPQGAQPMGQVPSTMAMDPSVAYGQYNGQFAGFDNFEFSLGGMGMDGDLYEPQNGEDLWAYTDPATMSLYQNWM